MKEFVLTQPYLSVDEMVNSGEVAVYKDELQNCGEELYAIVSRTGKRYDLFGNKIDDFAQNPFLGKNENGQIQDLIIIEEKKVEDKEMKYSNIEALIDAEVANAIEQIKAEHAKEIENLKAEHAKEILTVHDAVKAELLAKISG